MRKALTLLISSGLAALLAGGVCAAQFHVPLHMPPHPAFPGAESGRGFWLEAGSSRFKSGGIEISGPGGCFELSAVGEKKLGASVRVCGFSLSGKVDPLRLGRKTGGGFASSTEASLLWAPRGRDGYRFYAGGLLGLTVLDIRSPLNYTLSDGRLVVEPDTAYSIFFGLPVGAELPFGISRGWSGALQADVAVFGGGVTFFTYLGLPGSPLYGSSSGIDPQLAAGARLSFYYRPWRLFIEGAGRAYTGDGANEASSFTSLLAGIKF
ncbi:MAG: hypothetical protein A2X32_01970 [Elusimicrobia bacterium GWC2_64_44]|nr:MAG: hypothetical protein A2X32_01970 [Elusimicrobia bacterium GWC2_64_44]